MVNEAISFETEVDSENGHSIDFRFSALYTSRKNSAGAY